MARYTRMSLVALAFLLLTSVSLSAQSVLAVHAGVSIAKLGGSDVGTVSSRTGVNIGASITIPVSPVLGIQVGGAYAQKGATDNSSGTKVKMAIDYIEVPVLLRIGIPSESSVSAHFVVGPAVSFQAKCSASGSGGGVSVNMSCTDLGADTKTVDFGAMGGLGVTIAAGQKVQINFDALYNLGLTSIDNTGGSVKNRAFTLQAGLGVPLG